MMTRLSVAYMRIAAFTQFRFSLFRKNQGQRDISRRKMSGSNGLHGRSGKTMLTSSKPCTFIYRGEKIFVFQRFLEAGISRM